MNHAQIFALLGNKKEMARHEQQQEKRISNSMANRM